MIAFVTILGILWLLLIYIFYFRGKKLHAIICDITEHTHQLAEVDIRKGIGTWQNRYDYLDNLPHNKMLFEFWQPVNKYYENYMKSQEE